MDGIRETDLRSDVTATADGVATYRSWRTVRDKAVHAALLDRMVVVLGASGTGKSLLLRELRQVLLAAGRTVLLHRHGTISLMGSDVILIEDAERLGPNRLASLARLGHACVLVGAPALGDQVARIKPAPLVLRLRPLDLEEAAEFVAALQARSGQPTQPSGQAAISALWRLSSGMPGRLNQLFGLATFLARLADAPRLTEAHVTEASLIQGEASPSDDGALPEGDLADEFAHAVAGQNSTIAAASRLRAVPRWRRVGATVAAVLGEVATGAPALLAALLFIHSEPPGQVIGSQAPTVQAPVAQTPDAATPSTPTTGAAAERETPAEAVHPEAAAEASVPSPPPPVAPPASSQASGSGTEAAPFPTPAPGLATNGVGAVPDSVRLPELPALAITVLVPGGDAAADQAADTLLSTVQRLGLGKPPKKAIAQRPGPAALTYFFEEDAPRAADLGRHLGGEYGVAHLASRVPAPRPGTVEIALPASVPLPGPQANQPVNEARRRLRGRS